MKPSALSYLGQIKYSYFQLRNLKCLGNKIKFATTYRSGRSKYTSVKQAVACTLYKVRKSYCWGFVDLMLVVFGQIVIIAGKF